MTEIIRPGSGIIFMKVGTHARETLEDIIVRKTKEIENAGVAFWGYGGNTCHPQSMVQPFVRAYEERGKKVLLCMEEMESNHFADPIRADEYSVDGLEWINVPQSINVLGSRYALVIRALRREKADLPLASTRVAIGNSQGRPGDQYVAGRVDKACLEVISGSTAIESRIIHIGLVAELSPPFAVLLRNRS